MLDVAGDSTPIVFEGFGEGAELLGATQVNFFVHRLDREFGVTINDPALDRAVGEAGVENTPENRLAVARELARLLLQSKLQTRQLEPLNFFGLRLFDEHPGIGDRLRAALATA